LTTLPTEDRRTGGYERKPSVKFFYRVVVSSKWRVTKSWKPRGSFLDKSLSDLLRELPFTDDKFEGLTFVFDNHPYIGMVEYIPKDAH